MIPLKFQSCALLLCKLRIFIACTVNRQENKVVVCSEGSAMTWKRALLVISVFHVVVT